MPNVLNAAPAHQALSIERLDPSNARHAQALIELLDEYASGSEGGGAPLTEQAKAHLPAALAERAHYVGWLAFDGERAVGLLNAFEGLSTFKARPLLNIHDIAVAATHRGHGIGRALLAQAELEARRRNCCKLTLEALEGNLRAIGLYRDVGFVAYELDPAMGRATFFEKWLT
jgi:ribosomal protein S18 acetylase RimI-like enzyme